MAQAVNLKSFVPNANYFDPTSPNGFSRFGLQAFSQQIATLNGVVIPDSIAAAAHMFLSAYDATTGEFAQVQPSFSDIAGIVDPAQLPAATAAAQGALKLAGDLSGSASSPEVVSTHLSAPLPLGQGGTGNTAPSLVAGANVNISGSWPNQTIASSTTGFTGTIVTAKLTTLGANGSMIFTNGLLTSQSPAT